MENNRLLVALLGILTVIAVGFVFQAAQAVIIPLMIAWLLSYILGPVVNMMVARRVPLGVAVFSVLMLMLGVCYLGGVFLHARVQSFIDEYPRYESQLQAIAGDMAQRFPAFREALLDVNWLQWLSKWAMRLSGSFLSFFGNLVLVLIFLVFMLLGKPYSLRKIEHAFSGKQSERIQAVMSAIAAQIGKYLTIKLMISFVTGLLVWLACLLLKIDFPVTWGALAFFLNFIPTIGSIVATIPPVLLALVQFYPEYWHAVLALVFMLVIQQTMGSLLEPKIQGDNLNLSPVVVLISLVFWGWLWGVTGAILSVPLAAAIKIVCENIDPLKPISIMMGSGKFYARDR